MLSTSWYVFHSADYSLQLVILGFTQHPVQPGGLGTTTLGKPPHPPCEPISQNSLHPTPHPPHPPQHINTRATIPSTLSVPAASSASTEMQLDLEPIPPHDLVDLVSLSEPQLIALLSPITISSGPSSDISPGSVIVITGMYSNYRCCLRN